MSSKPNVLVAGGAGFSSHLIDRLLLEDLNVVCVDNFQTGNKENISHLINTQRVEVIRQDVCSPIDILANI